MRRKPNEQRTTDTALPRMWKRASADDQIRHDGFGVLALPKRDGDKAYDGLVAHL